MDRRKNRSWKERYGRIAGGNSKRTAGNRRYEADERKRNRHECALLVCGTSMVAAHLGFVLGVDAPATGALLAGKLTGGIAGVWMAWRIMK